MQRLTYSQWDDLRFVPEKSIWFLPSTMYRDAEVEIVGDSSGVRNDLLELAKWCVKFRDSLRLQAVEHLSHFCLSEESDQWIMDGIRIESEGEIDVTLTKSDDPYGYWEVTFRKVSNVNSDVEFIRKRLT